MSLLNAMILGLIQGIAEFLPISSSGHLSILNNLFHMTTTENGHMFFDVLLHLGTLFSVCVVYWQDIVQMFYEVLAFLHAGPLAGERRAHYPAARLFLMIVLGTIPLFQMVIEPIGYAEGWSTSAEYSVAKRCDIFGAADATVDQLNERLTDAIIVIAGLLVNGKGVSKEKMTEYLAEWNLDSYADIVYEIAVNQPIYLFKYEMGFCQQYSITERCREIFNFNDKDFYTEYLSWGPSYFDLLEPKLVSWAKACAESSDRA